MDTNKLTKQINTMLRPRAALIAYSTDGGDTYFLEVRSIDNEGTMSEGRPVTVDFMGHLKYGAFGLYVKYSPCNVFESGKGPKFQSWSTGITFGF